MANLLQKMQSMGLGDVYNEMAEMAQNIIASDELPTVQLDQGIDEETRAEIEAALVEYDDMGPEGLSEYTEEELAELRGNTDRELAAIRERATEAGRARFLEQYGESEEEAPLVDPVALENLPEPEEVAQAMTPEQSWNRLNEVNRQGTRLAGRFIQAMQEGNMIAVADLGNQLGMLRDQGDAIALDRLEQALQAPAPVEYSPEDEEAARLDADALAITPEDEEAFRQPQAPGISEEEADALLEAAEASANAELSAQQAEAAEAFSTQTLIFDIYVKGCVFTKRVPAEKVIKTDTERAQEAAQQEPQDQPALPLEEAQEAAPVANAGKAKKVAQRKILYVNKKMLEGPELDEIIDTVRRFKKWLDLRSLPCSILKGGKFVIPVAFVADVEERYQQFKRERKEAVRAFILAYDRLKAEARARFAEADLVSLFDETQYYPVEELPKMFSVAHSWTAFDAPQALQSIKAGLWEDANRQIKLTLADAANETRDALRASFAEYATWLVERLTDGGDDSKRKKGINENKVAQLQEFLATVDGLNLTGDQDLSRLVAQARNAVQGLDVKTLRDDVATRERVREAFATLQTESQSWIVDKSRMIALDEDAV